MYLGNRHADGKKPVSPDYDQEKVARLKFICRTNRGKPCQKDSSAMPCDWTKPLVGDLTFAIGF